MSTNFSSQLLTCHLLLDKTCFSIAVLMLLFVGDCKTKKRGVAINLGGDNKNKSYLCWVTFSKWKNSPWTKDGEGTQWHWASWEGEKYTEGGNELQFSHYQTKLLFKMIYIVYLLKVKDRTQSSRYLQSVHHQQLDNKPLCFFAEVRKHAFLKCHIVVTDV